MNVNDRVQSINRPEFVGTVIEKMRHRGHEMVLCRWENPGFQGDEMWVLTRALKQA